MIVSYWNDIDEKPNDRRLHFVDRNEEWFIGEMIISQKDCLSSVEIETINRCNNDCSFCPVSKDNDIRKPLRMKEYLFKKIIMELKERRYDGYLSLFSNNEPLLDVRLYDWLAYAKNELPDATHALFTNGTLLNSDKYKNLVKYLDYLVIDNYNDDLQLNENIKAIFYDTKNTDYNCKTRVYVRKKKQVLENRGGIAPNKITTDKYVSACALPFFQMVIRPDGKVSRCCQDAYGIDTLGDVSISSVWDVWNGKKYKMLRETLKKTGRSGVSACRSCDQFGLNNYYPADWDGTYYQGLIKWIRKKNQAGYTIYINEEIHATDLLNSLRLNEIKIGGIAKPADIIDWQCESLIFLHYDYDWIEESEKKGIHIVDNYIVYDWYRYPDEGRLDRKAFCKAIKKVRCFDDKGRLIIFGAGNLCKQLIDGYRLNPYLIVDNDSNKCGQLLMGHRIMSVQLLDENITNDCLIVIATRDYISVVNQLQKIGVNLHQVINGLLLQ